jgi:hypothetical protein
VATRRATRAFASGILRSGIATACDTPASLAAGVVDFHIGADDVGMQQLLGQAGEHAAFIEPRLDRAVVGAVAALALAGAAPLVVADYRPGQSTFPARPDAREQPLRPALKVHPGAVEALTSLAHRRPLRSGDDTELGRLGSHPLLG